MPKRSTKCIHPTDAQFAKVMSLHDDEEVKHLIPPSPNQKKRVEQLKRELEDNVNRMKSGKLNMDELTIVGRECDTLHSKIKIIVNDIVSKEKLIKEVESSRNNAKRALEYYMHSNAYSQVASWQSIIQASEALLAFPPPHEDRSQNISPVDECVPQNDSNIIDVDVEVTNLNNILEDEAIDISFSPGTPKNTERKKRKHLGTIVCWKILEEQILDER